MRFFVKILSLVVCLPFVGLCLALGWFSMGEGYNVFDPDIDTYYAPDYSYEGFHSVKQGMDSTEVIKKSGSLLVANPGSTPMLRDMFGIIPAMENVNGSISPGWKNTW